VDPDLINMRVPKRSFPTTRPYHYTRPTAERQESYKKQAFVHMTMRWPVVWH
jgi:hypothetical protein